MVNMDTLNLVGNVIITLQYENGDIFLFIKNSDSYGLIADDWRQQAISDIRLKSITIYPVKSCQGFSVQSWPLTTGGMHFQPSAVQLFSSICSFLATVLQCHYICDQYIMFALFT
jgi:hypothetical protein